MKINNKKIRFLNLSLKNKKEKAIYLNAISKVLDHGYLVMGPEINLLENKIANFCRRKYSISANSGTDALMMALWALGIKKNDEVISKLKPKIIFPFASFVYFSHEENFFWNDNNWLEHVFQKYSLIEPTLIFPMSDKYVNLNKIDKFNYEDSNKSALVFWKNKHKNSKHKLKIQVYNSWLKL